jgi:MFS family permease
VNGQGRLPPYPPAIQGWYAVSVLIIAYTFAYIDRTLLTLLVKPIRATLHISDLQLSLLSGFAFALFYTFLGIPIGRLVDFFSRRRIIVAGVAIWSVMAACCGLSRGFGQLFLARVGVGVGEAALSPAAFSMLADLFPAQTLPRVLGIYTAAIYIGSGLALIGGGVLIGLMPPLTLPLVGRLEPWQALFVAVGLPGLLISLLILTLREPQRRQISAELAGSITAGLRFAMHRRAAYGFLILGFSAGSLLWNGMFAWLPSFLIRNHGWTLPHVGLVIGCALLVFGTAGVTTGGVLSSTLRARGDTGAGLKIGILSAALVLPCGLAIPFVPGGAIAIAICSFVFAGSMPYGAAAAALQEITPNQMRGQISAVYLFGVNAAGIGFGPTFVAFLSQKLFHSDQALGLALAVTTALAAPLGICLLALGLTPYRRALAAPDF